MGRKIKLYYSKKEDSEEIHMSDEKDKELSLLKMFIKINSYPLYSSAFFANCKIMRKIANVAFVEQAREGDDSADRSLWDRSEHAAKCILETGKLNVILKIFLDAWKDVNIALLDKEVCTKAAVKFHVSKPTVRSYYKQLLKDCTLILKSATDYIEPVTILDMGVFAELSVKLLSSTTEENILKYLERTKAKKSGEAESEESSVDPHAILKSKVGKEGYISFGSMPFSMFTSIVIIYVWYNLTRRFDDLPEERILQIEKAAVSFFPILVEFLYSDFIQTYVNPTILQTAYEFISCLCDSENLLDMVDDYLPSKKHKKIFVALYDEHIKPLLATDSAAQVVASRELRDVVGDELDC
ncbi:hypothetical protein ADUPG1_013710 [Aduncisulcus paluster]|uniref:Uncharacterized protein n=1 Tax=Aduncisulcus paluster TaxID=2918883 RepID=A0ABQ5K3U3_9EUKA|nr:hypothetical protein ADUPG1_013710 [Aduncisulcus paluster]|eukprot:gnl/Carplike_NY0171/6107_a8380_177.p1 GENE.gnl/Carplike_NY0171/6107_a8380_177~~gnl/Carplike_NY0171/6107_a8380_177.p1  ORF type:complete len:355 (+),score=69.30 gnl/Carplike_NY0171/6107_a8380_177:40-1104(+)